MGTRGHLGGLAEATLQAAAPPGRVGKGSRLPRDRRRGAERGRGDRHRRHRAARPDAGLGRFGAGAEGGDHGDPGRDRRQQARPSGREDDGVGGAVGPRARRRARLVAADRPHRGAARARASRSCGTSSARHRAHLEEGGESRGAPTAEPRRARCSRSRPSRAKTHLQRAVADDPELRRLARGGPAARARSAHGGARDHAPRVHGWTDDGRARTLAEIEAARARLAGVSRVTPVVSSETLSRLAERPVVLKAENLQRTGAFKIRGRVQHDRAARRGRAKRGRGHGERRQPRPGGRLGGARRQGSRRRSSSRWPRRWRRSRRRRRTARPFASPATGSTRRSRCAHRVERETGATFVHAFEDPRVIAGQGTLGLELAEQLEGPHTVVVPVGGGGLAAGVAIALEALCDRTSRVRRRPGRRLRTPRGRRRHRADDRRRDRGQASGRADVRDPSRAARRGSSPSTTRRSRRRSCCCSSGRSSSSRVRAPRPSPRRSPAGSPAMGRCVASSPAGTSTPPRSSRSCATGSRHRDGISSWRSRSRTGPARCSASSSRSRRSARTSCPSPTTARAATSACSRPRRS